MPIQFNEGVDLNGTNLIFADGEAVERRAVRECCGTCSCGRTATDLSGCTITRCIRCCGRARSCRSIRVSRRIQPSRWRTEFDRPIYFLELRNGYACGWCEVQGNELALLPHPLVALHDAAICVSRGCGDRGAGDGDCDATGEDAGRCGAGDFEDCFGGSEIRVFVPRPFDCEQRQLEDSAAVASMGACPPATASGKAASRIFSGRGSVLAGLRAEILRFAQDHIAALGDEASRCGCNEDMLHQRNVRF